MVKAREIPTRHAEPQKQAAATAGDTVFAILDRLAGGGNNLKIDFDDLTVGMGPLEARVNGSVGIDVELAK